MKILVYIQEDQGNISSISLEAIVGAQEIAAQTAGSVTAVTFNSQAGEKLTNYDLTEILVVEDETLNTYHPLHFIKAMEETVTAEAPNLIVFGHSYEARDWVPRLSARLDIPFISDCIQFKMDGDLTFVRSIHQGKFNSNWMAGNESYIVSFQSGAFRVDSLEAGSAAVRNISVDLSGVADSINPGEKFQEAESSVDLSQADVIVSVGRGIGKEENLQLVYDLSKALGGEVASSRPVVDSGWLEPFIPTTCWIAPEIPRAR